MWQYVWQLASFVCMFTTGYGSKRSYEGYKLFHVTPTDLQQLHVLREFGAVPWVDFFTFPKLDGIATLAVPPEKVGQVNNQLLMNGMNFKVSDLQRLLDEEEVMLSKSSDSTYAMYASKSASALRHDRYLPLDKIESILHRLAEAHDGVTLMKMPHRTFKRNTMYYLRIDKGGNTIDKPVVIVESLIHGREWITGAATLYAMARMLKKFEAGDKYAMFMLNNFTWIFIPVTNPDGYSYTWTEDRLWRKNRRYVKQYCVGVDLNRNFDIMFQEGVPASRLNCGNVFSGAHAFSEAETKNVRRLVNRVKPRLLAYVSIHSYSQLVVASWGWTTERPQGSKELDRVGRKLAETMSGYGVNYTFGVGKDVVGYSYTGTSVDWVLSTSPWAYTYAFELRPDAKSHQTFILPPSEIVPSGQEVYASFVTLSREIKDRRHLFKRRNYP